MPTGYITQLSKDDEISIRNMYLNEKLGVVRIARKYHISSDKVKEIIGFDNLRSLKEAHKIAVSKRPKSFTPEQKERLRLAMVKLHAEGRHPGWSHINSNKDRRSFPEKVFLNQLIIHKLNEKYTFVEKFPFSKYFLDFALIDFKIDVEIDGQQHFRNDAAISHDKERDSYLMSKGWKVYRIAYKEMELNLEKVMVDFINWLETEDKNAIRRYSINEIKLSYKKKGRAGKTPEEKLNSYRRIKKFEISKEELEELVKKQSMRSIGRKFGVTSASIKKRCKKLGIILPKYYWQNNILNTLLPNTN